MERVLESFCLMVMEHNVPMCFHQAHFRWNVTVCCGCRVRATSCAFLRACCARATPVTGAATVAAAATIVAVGAATDSVSYHRTYLVSYRYCGFAYLLRYLATIATVAADEQMSACQITRC